MRLTDIPAALMHEMVRTWTRRLIAGFIVFAFAIAVIVHGIAAARLALEPAVGLVWARVILVAVFLAIIALTLAWLYFAERRDAARKRDRSEAGPDQKAAVIAEAVSLGYALARDFKRARAADNAEASDPATAAAKAADRRSAQAAE
jgi:type VI protein secretion system component VasK